jgi:hypothetical protein
MLGWLDSVAGPGYAAALLWTFAALVLLVIVLIIIKLVRNLTFGTFVAGGRNRKTRLAVMDATAVDSYPPVAMAAYRPAQISTSASAVRQAPPPAPARRDSIDDTLMKELEVSLDDPRPSKPASKVVAKAPPSLDDEMTKLLGEISSQKR